MGERRGQLTGVGFGHLVHAHAPSSLKAPGSHCRPQAGRDGIKCGLGSLRLQSGNESSGEQSGLGQGGGGEEGRRFSLQRTKKLRAGLGFFLGGGPQALCLEVLHHHPHTLLLLLDSSTPLWGRVSPFLSGISFLRRSRVPTGTRFPSPRSSVCPQSWDSLQEHSCQAALPCPAQPRWREA